MRSIQAQKVGVQYDLQHTFNKATCTDKETREGFETYCYMKHDIWPQPKQCAFSEQNT